MAVRARFWWSPAVVRRQEVKRRRADAKAIRVLWIIFVLAMIVGVVAQPGQMPGESAAAYILSDRSNWVSSIANIVAAFAASPLLMLYLMRGPNDGR